MKAFLPKESLVPFLDSISSRIEVVAPVKIEGTPVFASWNGQPLALEENPLLPPQEFLLPQREVLFRYIQDCGMYTFEETLSKPRLIFGIRPCDLKALAVLDRVLGSEPADYHYFDKRRSTVLIGLNCTQPGEGCFCAPLHAGPEASDTSDLQLTDLGEGYLAETLSSAGVLILKEHPEFFMKAERVHLSQKREILERSKEAMQAYKERSRTQIKQAIEMADWDALGRRCLSCGGCTFVCPVCHCFNILDLGVPDGERVRCKDTCILSGFSRMTSGVNPRRSQGDRMQNWYRDKFDYIPQKTGLIGCVGCGRCSRACPAEIDRWTLEVTR
jgi:sulfhydrogenase subunit beta (sulfur reductase)